MSAGLERDYILGYSLGTPEGQRLFRAYDRAGDFSDAYRELGKMRQEELAARAIHLRERSDLLRLPEEERAEAAQPETLRDVPENRRPPGEGRASRYAHCQYLRHHG